MPDRLRTGNRGNDRNGQQLLACQMALNAGAHFTFRESRHLVLGGPPNPAPHVPYPGIPYLRYYLNHALLPSLIEPRKYKIYFGVEIQVIFGGLFLIKLLNYSFRSFTFSVISTLFLLFKQSAE